MNKNIFTFKVKDMVEIAMFCALAVVLDKFLKIPLGPTGGSLNLSMVPIFVISLRHGWFKGFVAGGLIFGFITCLLDGYGLITYPLEYLVSFGIMGILGFFSHFIQKSIEDNNKSKIVLSYVLLLGSVCIMFLVRLFAASLDSVLLWDYEWGPALIYNLTYVGPSLLISTVIFSLLLPVIVRINNYIKSSFLKD